MQYSLETALPVLRRTPACLSALLSGLPEAWTRSGPGGDGWSPYDVVGHLIHGERADWMPRAKSLLAHGESRPWQPFDRLAQQAEDQTRPIEILLDEFAALRRENIDALQSLALTEDDWPRTGLHPEFGRVTLAQLLATWVAHDLSHVAQIARTMARQYADQIGPWSRYLPILES